MELYRLIKKITETFDAADIPHFITGSVASMYFGEPRLTIDVDVVADIREVHIPFLLNAFPKGDYYISEIAIREAIRNFSQFNILDENTALKADVIIPALTEFNKQRFQRSSRQKLAPDVEVNISTAEDVVLMKMKYYQEGESEKHINDIVNVLKICGEDIDREYIRSWSEKLGIGDVWQTILKKTSDS